MPKNDQPKQSQQGTSKHTLTTEKGFSIIATILIILVVLGVLIWVGDRLFFDDDKAPLDEEASSQEVATASPSPSPPPLVLDERDETVVITQPTPSPLTPEWVVENSTDLIGQRIEVQGVVTDRYAENLVVIGEGDELVVWGKEDSSISDQIADLNQMDTIKVVGELKRLTTNNDNEFGFDEDDLQTLLVSDSLIIVVESLENF